MSTLKTARAVYNHDGCYVGQYGATLKGGDELFFMGFPISITKYPGESHWIGLQYKDHYGQPMGKKEDIREEFLKKAREEWPDKDWSRPDWVRRQEEESK